MSVIVYGRRAYGRVRAHGGEHLETVFAHVDFLPLFPIKSQWITHDLGKGQRTGFPVPLHARSVAAGYLRIWGPPLACAALAVPVVGVALAGVLAALTIWSWTWRSLRGAAAARRSDFNRVAFGSRCEPAWLPEDLRRELEAQLQAAWERRDDPRPPDDVARFGAKDANEAVLAYGLLRLAAVRHRSADGHAAAERILASAYEVMPSDGGPYRGSEELGGAPAAPPTFGDAVHARAAEYAAASRTSAEAHAASTRRDRKRRWIARPGVQLAGLLLLTPIAVGCVANAIAGGRAPLHVTARQLARIHPPVGRPVVVSCDAVGDDGWQVVSRDDASEVQQRIVFCAVGPHVLPVVLAASEAIPGPGPATIAGELHELPMDSDSAASAGLPWLDALHANTALDARSFDVYLDRDPGGHTGDVVAALVTSLGLAAGWLFWLRAWRRRRAARRAA